MMPASDSQNISFLILLLISILSPFPFQIILVRGFGLFREKDSRQKGPIWAGIAGLGLTICLYLSWIFNFPSPSFGGYFLSGFYLFGVYSISAYVYFHIFNMSETARRVRILAELYRVPGQAWEELEKRYQEDDMVNIRLERLIALGEIKLEKDSYRVDRGCLLIPAKLIFGFRKILFPGK
jgi:hypothetical protein